MNTQEAKRYGLRVYKGKFWGDFDARSNPIVYEPCAGQPAALAAIEMVLLSNLTSREIQTSSYIHKRRVVVKPGEEKAEVQERVRR